MPSPGQGQAGMAAALAALQKQMERLARRLIDLAHLDQSGAADGEVPVWNDTTKVWEPGVGAVPVLFVSTTAGGPPTDGSVFWYVTDESC